MGQGGQSQVPGRIQPRPPRAASESHAIACDTCVGSWACRHSRTQGARRLVCPAQTGSSPNTMAHREASEKRRGSPVGSGVGLQDVFFCFVLFCFCGTRASHCCGLYRCGAQAPDAQAQRPWLTGPAAPRHVGSSWTGARTRVPCIGRWTLNHCTTREAPLLIILVKNV